MPRTRTLELDAFAAGVLPPEWDAPASEHVEFLRPTAPSLGACVVVIDGTSTSNYGSELIGVCGIVVGSVNLPDLFPEPIFKVHCEGYPVIHLVPASCLSVLGPKHPFRRRKMTEGF